MVDLGLDAATIAAAFLHDVIEDTPASEGDIKKEFGEEVLELVLGVTKLEKIEFTSKEEEQAENFRKIFVAMAKDIRVIIIKLADRLHNMRSLNFLSIERQQRMARETLDVFAPLADRLGISQIKCELEDLCLKYLEPEFYEYLSTNVDERLRESEIFVENVVKEVKKILDDAHITCNKNAIPNDPRSPKVTSGVRLGTPAVTTRGMKEADMDKIAEAVAMVIRDECYVGQARRIVESLTEKYPLTY